MLRFFKKMFSEEVKTPPPKRTPPKPIDYSKRVIRADVTESPLEKTPEPDLDAVYESLSDVKDHIDLGPGKSVIARRPRYQLESGSYDTLEIVEEVEDVGVDPYNSGAFDNRTHWQKPKSK